MTRKNIAFSGIIICSMYFVITSLLIVTSSKLWLTALELITMLSGIFMIMLIAVIPGPNLEKMKRNKMLAIIFSSACMILTNAVHMVNLSVTQKLIDHGIAVPDYLVIGTWPSVEMAIDYLAWGLFMGLAFLFSSIAMENEGSFRILKITLCVCGSLCFLGFFGAILMNPNLWYIAPMGYGLGTLVICFELLIITKN